MSNFRRSWSEVGKKAVLPQQQAFINSYLYSAVAPVTGQTFHLMNLSDMDTETETIFLTELKKQHPNQHVVVVIDNAPCHRPKILHKIPGLSIIYLPSYSPQLNPVERFFEELRRATANRIFKTMDELETRLTEAINSWTLDILKQLCGYDWVLAQLG